MKFEYLIKYNLTLNELNSLGFVGWELITIVESNKFYFKRIIDGR